MRLPTREQMQRLSPVYHWEEPNYKDEQWKYDPPLLVAWDELMLERQEVPSQTLADGVTVESLPLREEAVEANVVASLIDGIYEVGILIRIPRNCKTHLVLDSLASNYAFKKIVIMVEEGAYVTCENRDVLHTLSIQGISLTVHVAATAQFHYSQQGNVADDVIAFRSFIIHAATYSTVTLRSTRQGGRYTKTFVTAYLTGASAQVSLHFSSRLKGTHYDNLITEQHHRAPATLSHCSVKYAQYKHARSFYNGHIVIEKDGAHSEASQDHKALLLDREARAVARPTLEVKTHEVQCGHGSAIGMLDEEQLWYLQSRGIVHERAEQLLVDAFFSEAFV